MNLQTLETERLLLKVLQLEDILHLFEHYSQQEVMDLYGLQTDKEYEQEKYKCENGFTTYRTKLVIFLLVEKATQTTIGRCSFHNYYPDHRRTEIGYAIANDIYKNKGYMGEALPRIIDYGFNDMNLNRIEAFISPTNAASLRLVEANGFTREGLLRQHYNFNDKLDDSVVYGLLREEWNKVIE